MADHNRNPEGIGGFKPGQSGNPGGRAGASHSLSALRLRMRALTDEATDKLADLMRNGGDPVQLAACREIFDRAYGKPKQQVDLDIALTKKISDLSIDELRALERRLVEIEGVPADTGPATLELLALPNHEQSNA